jgi:hypothetical protein
MMALAKLRSRAVIALLIAVAACSVTDYQEPITKFATASKHAETALTALNTEVTDAYTALLQERAVTGQGLVEEQAGDCLSDSEHCRLDLLSRDGTTQPLTPPPALGNMVVLMQSITIYANNLVALVSADSAAAVTTSVNATLGSIESLADTVEKAGGNAQTVNLAAYRTPVGEAASWIVGQYVARVKLDGLRRATTEAQPVIAEAARVFEVAAAEAAVVPRATMAQDVRERLNAFDASPSQANLELLIQSADQLNQLLQAKPSDVFAEMSRAHAALTNELQGKDVTLAQAIARIEIFAVEAERLVKIARTFAAAANAES